MNAPSLAGELATVGANKKEFRLYPEWAEERPRFPGKSIALSWRSIREPYFRFGLGVQSQHDPQQTNLTRSAAHALTLRFLERKGFKPKPANARCQ